MGSGKVHRHKEPHFDIMDGPDRYCQCQDLEVHWAFQNPLLSDDV